MVQLQPQAVALDGVLTHGTNGNPANDKPVSLLPSSPVPAGLVVGELKREPVESEASCQMFVLLKFPEVSTPTQTLRSTRVTTDMNNIIHLPETFFLISEFWESLNRICI